MGDLNLKLKPPGVPKGGKAAPLRLQFNASKGAAGAGWKMEWLKTLSLH